MRMNENANVQSKNCQEANLVYCTKRTKRLMIKTKNKTIEQFRVREASLMDV